MIQTPTPIQRYHSDLECGKISPDSSQAAALKELQNVFDALVKRWHVRPSKKRFLLRLIKKDEFTPISGLYFWGGVGRGKTYLMDLFYQCLPSERKMRVHFHRFMKMVHNRMNEAKGESDPLKLVARNIAQEIDIICFDEFFVSDIGDAMILTNILEALFEQGVTLIATSNIPPVKLYENGLQRENFIPAITLLERYTKVVNLDGGRDYRLRSLKKAEIYHSPLDLQADLTLLECFSNLAGGQVVEESFKLEVLGREIEARHWSEGLVWLDFSEICGSGRSAADYIEIAQLFHTVILSNIPRLDSTRDDLARRFISLVDEFYDHNVSLVISAAESLTQLYQGTELSFAFERTVSRLLEMQSHGYLAREHKP